VEFLAREGYTLNSSIGLQTWELITALGSRARVPMTLFLIVHSTGHFNQLTAATIEQYDLDPSLVTFVPVTADTSKDKSTAMQARDRIIFEKSRLLVPVAVRENGTMARRLERPGPNHDLEPSFRTEYVSESTACAEDFSSLPVNLSMGSETAGYLFHWTRTAESAWPGEKQIDYYSAVLASATYPRLAIHTLQRIAKARLLRASREHMPGRAATVALTSLTPSKVIPLMTWRARYGRMAFESYAIGIRRRSAESMGVVPVHYYDKRDKRSIAELPPWQTQSRGEISDWTVEQEYRHPGDLDLGEVDPTELLLICRRPSEAAALETATGIRTLALFTVD
jgi:hypothetical protein